MLSAEAPGFEPLELRFEAVEAESREVLVPKLVPRPEEQPSGPMASEPRLASADGRDTWRTVGWISQWKEMLQDPQLKIGRPRQLYTGATYRDYADVENR